MRHSKIVIELGGEGDFLEKVTLSPYLAGFADIVAMFCEQNSQHSLLCNTPTPFKNIKKEE